VVEEPRMTPERTVELGDARLTIARPECPLCGRPLVREDPQWRELRELYKGGG